MALDNNEYSQEWIFYDTEISSQSIIQNGNRMFCGNGFMGYRGTVDEASVSDMQCLIVNGIYDQFENKWREPVNFPNPVFIQLQVDQNVLNLQNPNVVSHYQQLDFKYGIFSRKTVWNVDGELTVQSKRFLSMKDRNTICLEYTITSARNITIAIDSSINTKVFDANGPHFTVEKNTLQDCSNGLYESLLCRTVENNNYFVVSHFVDCSKKKIKLSAGQSITFHVYASIITLLDFPQEKADDKKLSKLMLKKAELVIENAKKLGFQSLLNEHKIEWDKIWETGDVIIQGDKEAQRNVRYSLYHLQCVAPRGRNALSVPARGLSAQTYKGAIFWDTELFIFPYFLYTTPQIARSLLEYRIKTLEGAKRKAAFYGYKGAFYAWESQEDGDDACSDYNVVDVFTKRPMRTYFKENQIHINAAIVYALMQYVQVTGDINILEEGGYSVIFECAKFYISRCVYIPLKDRYEMHNVIGPDEYHENINNNAYTNKMVLFTINTALKYVDKVWITQYGFDSYISLAYDICKKLYVPSPNIQNNNLIEQFDSYFSLEDCSVDDVRARLLDSKEYWGGANGVASHTQVIKQADVVVLLNLFSLEYEANVMESNFDYYNLRTEHGSSLSACMYGLLACKLGRSKEALDFFNKTCSVDLSGNSKQWAGLIYIGGTHPAAQGGTWMMTIYGFCGFSVIDGTIKINPALPEKWEKVSFCVGVRDKTYKITVTKDGYELCKK